MKPQHPLPTWLTGTWSGEKNGRAVILNLSLAEDERIIGSEIVIDFEKRRLLHQEHMEIKLLKGHLQIEVFPLGQKSLVMKASSCSENQVVFENPEHDFPKIWSFVLDSNGSLLETAIGDNFQITNQLRPAGGDK